MASSKDADVGQGALIDIFTGLPVSAGHKAHVTLAAVASGGVEALAIATEVQVLRALIQVCACEAVARVALLAQTAVGPQGVLAVCMLAAQVSSIGALIQVCALNAISNPAGAAATPEASRSVGAHSVPAAVVGSNFTFINVCTARLSFFARVAHVTVADERTFRVFASST